MQLAAGLQLGGDALADLKPGQGQPARVVNGDGNGRFLPQKDALIVRPFRGQFLNHPRRLPDAPAIQGHADVDNIEDEVQPQQQGGG